ncbi:MAG: hypothetical protein ACRCU2_11645, partial [Planktothrix sp.]
VSVSPYQFPARGRKRLDLVQRTRSLLVSPYQFPARGRKLLAAFGKCPSKASLYVSPYQFPARGRKRGPLVNFGSSKF